jgi:hypothetical protein
VDELISSTFDELAAGHVQIADPTSTGRGSGR